MAVALRNSMDAAECKHVVLGLILLKYLSDAFEGDRRKDIKDGPRWACSTPPGGNAHYAWVQHFIHHLAPTGLATCSMSSNQSGEGEIRHEMKAEAA